MMSSRTDKKLAAKEDEDFLRRWSRRKQETLSDQQDTSKVITAAPVEDADTLLPTDIDMPPIESLTEDSDYSGFLSPKVSEALRKQALRKLFHSPGFNICDGLDDYDGDYTKFEKLGSIVTADMKHQIEMEARLRMQQLTETETETEDAKETTEVGPMTASDKDNVTTEELLADAETERTIDEDGDAEVDL